MIIEAFTYGISAGLTMWGVVAAIGFVKRAANSLT